MFGPHHTRTDQKKTMLVYNFYLIPDLQTKLWTNKINTEYIKYSMSCKIMLKSHKKYINNHNKVSNTFILYRSNKWNSISKNKHQILQIIGLYMNKVTLQKIIIQCNLCNPTLEFSDIL